MVIDLPHFPEYLFQPIRYSNDVVLQLVNRVAEMLFLLFALNTECLDIACRLSFNLILEVDHPGLPTVVLSFIVLLLTNDKHIREVNFTCELLGAKMCLPLVVHRAPLEVVVLFSERIHLVVRVTYHSNDEIHEDHE